MNPIKHQMYDFLRLVGMRDRLRCPACQVVGTWKPHGGWLDFEDERKVRRWLCKWCGLYVGPEGYKLAGVGESAWSLEPEDEGKTPKNAMLTVFGAPVNPWRG